MLTKFHCRSHRYCSTAQTISGAVSYRRVGNPRRCAAIMLDAKSYQWNIMSMDFARYYSWPAIPEIFFKGALRFWGHVILDTRYFEMPPILCWKRSTAASFVGSKDGLGLCCATSGSATEAWDLSAKVWRNDCEYNVDGKNGLVCRVMGVNNGAIISGQRFWNLMEFHLFWTQIITKMLWTLTSLVHLSPCIFLSLDGFHWSVVWAGQPMGRCDRTSELVLAQCLEFHGRFVGKT